MRRWPGAAASFAANPARPPLPGSRRLTTLDHSLPAVKGPGPMTPTADARSEDTLLQAALTRDGDLRRLPPPVERKFRHHYQARANQLLQRYSLPLLALEALALVPVWLFRDEPSLLPWVLAGGAPIALALLLLATAARHPGLQRHMAAIMGAGLFTCLSAALFCASYLDGQYFGHFSKFLVIYVLVATYTVLQLPLRVATPAALGALLSTSLAILVLRGTGSLAFWLEIAYYAVVPLMLCSVAAYSVESAERRNFVQRRLLERESLQLSRLHAEAEQRMRAQARQAEYLALIGGNHSLKELFTRTLRFLVEHTGAQVGAAYHLGSRGQLRRVADWALDAGAREAGAGELDPGSTLMGPALQSGEPVLLRQLRADYLRIDVGMGSLPCAALLVLPIVQGGQPLAVIELGKLSDFSAEAVERAVAIRAHLAYAVAAANARATNLRTVSA